MRTAIFITTLFLTTSLVAQNDPYLSWEVVEYHLDGELSGMVTSRLYANLQNETDFVVSCSGYDENHMHITSSSSPAWWNHPLGETAFATDIDVALFNSNPLLPFDTWLTIGSENDEGNADVIDLADPDEVFFQSFIEEEGYSISATTEVGNAWFVLPIPTNSDAVAGEDLKVLLGQFTTSGQISGQLQLQVFLEGSNTSEFRSVVPIPFSPAPTPCALDSDGDDICDDVDPCVGELDECGVCNGPGAIYECGCSAIPEGDCDCDGNQLDVVGVCGGECLTDEDGNGTCDNEEVYGCSYTLAVNYEAAVTRDDGSCLFEPCGFGTVWDEDSQTCILDESNCGWQPDGNADGLVGVSDLLDLLGVYGDVDMDGDGVWDSGDLCVDTSACNYSTIPSESCAFIDVLGVCGGGCEADEDNDGICDDVDSCVGVEDECGVCNGPGPTEIVIDQIITTYDSIFLPVDEEWFVYAVEVDTIFSYECAPFFGNCGNPVSYQGYDYATVLIGDQCWFAENLRNENYENGDAIPAGLSDSEWFSTTSGAVAVYGEGSSTCYSYSPDGDACDEAWSLNEYGRLYNWYAVDDPRGLCPSGWHVPTAGEWTVMTDFLGGTSVAGGQMKTDYGWYNGGNGTNSSGFSGLPGGTRDYNGYFVIAGLNGYWWSSSPNGSSAWGCYLYGSSEFVLISSNNRRYGFSVRCVRDAE